MRRNTKQIKSRLRSSKLGATSLLEPDDKKIQAPEGGNTTMLKSTQLSVRLEAAPDGALDCLVG